MLLLLFAHRGEWSRKVTPHGVCLDLPLTLQPRASLCGVRRPTATIASQSPTKQGLLAASHATGDCCCGTQRRTDAAGPGHNTRTRSGLDTNQSSLCRGGGLNSSRAAPYSD